MSFLRHLECSSLNKLNKKKHHPCKQQRVDTRPGCEKRDGERNDIVDREKVIMNKRRRARDVEVCM